MPHSGLQSTIQLALHFGGVNATPGFLLNGWRKLIFPFRWYGSRPTYEYAIGLLLLCCILFTVSLHISVAHFDLSRRFIWTLVYEHCRFHIHQRHLSSVRLLPPLTSSMSLELKKGPYIIAALFFWGFALVSFLFPFFFLSADWHCLLEEISHI